MRDFLDAILTFIGSESLTDSEFDGITLTGDPAYTKETYLALRAVLEARENVSGQTQRLKLYFIARGVDVSETPPVPKAQSNIFIGCGLDDSSPVFTPEVISGPQGPAGNDGQDGTSIILKAGIIAPESFSGSPKKYSVVFATPFTDSTYVISVTAVDSRSWTYESKTANGFTINSNASTALSGEVSWTATAEGET